MKAEEWIWFGQEIQHRAALGKESELCLHDRPLPLDRVAREIARHKNKIPAGTLQDRKYTNAKISIKYVDLMKGRQIHHQQEYPFGPHRR